MDGVLKSWAVPKGPSLNPADKRLAMMVEDHPFSYRTFEGTIPEGSYGAGEVEIWDEGFYEPMVSEKGKTANDILVNELEKGSLKLILHGKKLKGQFALVRMHTAKEENTWLLIKHNDEFAVKEKYDAENETSSDSKVTKLAKKKYKNYKKPQETRKKRHPAIALSGQEKLSDYITPMLATTGDNAFDNEEWIFEIKWDGYRAVADVSNKPLQLYSRNGLSFLGKYPVIENELKEQTHPMILDGEIVAYNEDGKPDFQALQHFDDDSEVTLIYHVFDLLFLNGHSTKDLPLIQRKELLRDALTETPHVKFCDHVEREGKAFYNTILEANLEGMMAKKKSSTYREGIRSEEWIKIKNHNTDEAVILGYTQPKGSRKYFGSLILAKYHEGELRFAGHVGTGFNDKSLKEIHGILEPLETKKMPFDKNPPTNTPPTWVKPRLVCTVKYAELTNDGLFRHPVFIGLREDLDAELLYEESVGKNTSTVNEPASSPSNPEVKYTNRDKLYWKKEKITKGDLIDYYLSVSDYILPHLKDRAQSLHRFPNGIDGMSFYHKDAGKDAPSWAQTVQIFSESTEKEIEYIVCNNKETLGYLVNLGCIELNPWNSRIQHPDNPDYLIFDLDPSEKNTFKQVIETAQVTKEILDTFEVPAYCKTSGSSGIHIYVPTGAQYSYEQVRDFANLIMQLVQQRLPNITTLERALRKRGAKIYLDYLQNRMGQTVASVYSVRPKPGATVSMPIEWDELTPDLSLKDFTIHNALLRLSKMGDIFSPVLGEGIDLEKVLNNLSNNK
jgi:bifunctional non-homologous end joining protein LigD